MKSCKHEYIFIMGKDVPLSMHTATYRRVHWCWKCGKISVSTPNYNEKDYSVGEKPKDEKDN